jgi:hypothetical protein
LGGKTGLANRFTDRNRDGLATSMVRRHNVRDNLRSDRRTLSAAFHEEIA